MAPESALSRAIAKIQVVAENLLEKRWVRRAFVGTCLALAILVTSSTFTTSILAYNSYRDFGQLIDDQISGGYLRSHAGLYAAPRVIETGARISPEELVASLQRAGYAKDTASSIWSGSFQVRENQIRILPRQGTEVFEWIDVTFNQNGTIASLSTNDRKLRSYSLEPELLTPYAGLKTGQQQTVTYGDIPPILVQSIVAIEDRRFFEHHGLDARGITRAFVRWATSGFVTFRQGGSTITQQLVKNTYLTPEKTLRRKFNEAMLALALEQRLSKQDIFALYCNEVYLGQRNGVGVRGVAQAAQVYFGKDLKDLSLAEAATIAGMIQSPARYAPDRHPEEAKARRDLVIAAMIQDGAINQETAQSVSQAPLTVAKFESDANEFAPYYIDSVNRAVETVPVSLSPEAEDPEEAEFEHNLRVQTTIDPDLQAAAENALRHQLDRLSKTRPGQSQPQGAMVALDVHTGDVLAMVGGRNYADSQLNRATDARRQPGSVFKPFVYAAAFESGISPLTVVRDEPRTFHYGTATYAPANYGGAYSMHEVLLRDGLVRSLNVVTVDLAMRIGLIKVADTASRMGLPRPDSYPSMALGTFEVTPLQVAAAYAAFANGGRPVEPRFVKGSVDDAEVTMPADSSEQRQVLRATTAYMITDALSDVIERGTASRAKGSFRNVAIAGKTGTSRDGWFVGYTPNLVCVVWVGFDDNEQLGMTGAEAALPAWVDFMKEALAVRPSLGGSAFPKPGSILTVKVDPESGALAGPNCPSAQTVSVDSRFSPALECYVHRPDYDDEIMLSDYSGENLFEDRERVNSATESDDFDDETPDASTQSDRDLRESVSKPKRRTTRTEVNDRGQARLVTDPTAAIHTAKRPASPTQYRPQ